MKFELAPDIHEEIKKLVLGLKFEHVDPSRIVCMRSSGSKSRANARIWGMPRIWQQALNIEPHYVIEVLSQYFDNLPKEEKEKTLIHELLHIPKTFSGALVPHKCFGKKIDRKRVEKLYREYKKYNLD